MRQSNHRMVFTLVEILAATAIVAILIGVAIGAAGIAKRTARTNKAKALLQALDAGMKQYYQKWGFYPCVGTAETLNDLIIYETDNNGNNSIPPMVSFFEIAKADREVVTAGVTFKVKDPFGNNKCFLYRYPGKFNRMTYDLGCKGYDGQYGTASASSDDFGKGDDITNFKRVGGDN